MDENPKPTEACHAVGGPWSGHCVNHPFSCERPVRAGPRHCGQSSAKIHETEKAASNQYFQFIIQVSYTKAFFFATTREASEILRDGMSVILEVHQLRKTYRSGEGELTVLNDVSFTLNQGDSMAIVGPSGSGKTTLLGLCAGLDLPTSGRVAVLGRDLGALDEDGRASLRNKSVGFVFQNFQLLPTLTALENVMVPMELMGKRGVRERAMDLLAQVGLSDRASHYPAQLSGGEQQRVAMARAFINEPRLLFADEPTGNLDSQNSDHIVELLFGLNKAAGTALALVTHNHDLAQLTRRILRLKAGAVVEDTLTRAA